MLRGKLLAWNLSLYDHGGMCRQCLRRGAVVYTTGAVRGRRVVAVHGTSGAVLHGGQAVVSRRSYTAPVDQCTVHGTAPCTVQPAGSVVATATMH